MQAVKIEGSMSMVSMASLHNMLNVEGGLIANQLLACCMLGEYVRSGGASRSAQLLT